MGYIDKYLTRTNFLTSSDIAVGTFSKNIFMYGKKYAYRMGDGVWTALLVNKSVPHLKLTAQYLKVKDAVVNSTDASVGDIIGLENYNKDIDALSLNLKYNFAKVGVKCLMMLGRYTQYMSGSNPTLNGNKDLNAYDFVAIYAFSGSLKGQSLALTLHGVILFYL